MRGVLTPGSVVGPYTVLDLLGQGGMGIVYRARDSRLERTVALKVIGKREAIVDADGTSHSADDATRLLREARAVASLSHPNVVAIYDVGETEELLYFAMEHVEGENLRARMSHPPSLSERIRWLADVATGLFAAHEAGLVHRDVKPENVMVRSDGLVKVLDFGIARKTRIVEADGEIVTGEDHVAGTPQYMAPEQLRGERLDARSDQFSWAVVAYELLSGRRPFSSSTEGYALVASILSDAPPPLRDLVPEIPFEVEQVVHRALAKAAGDRFASLAEVAEILHPQAQSLRPQRTPSSIPKAAIGVKHHEPAAFAETTRVPTTKDEPPPQSLRSVEKKLTPKVTLATAIGLAALALVTVVFVSRPRTPSPAHPKVVRPSCTVPEAAAALESARGRTRDGATQDARRELERAVSLDESCAAAHLELGLAVLSRDPQDGLRHYQAAFHARDALGPRDLALLEASEPYVRSRPDLVEWETRLTAAVYKFPDDAALRVWLGTSRERQLDFEGARTAYEAATRASPGYAPAWAGLAHATKRLGDKKGALDAVASCLARSPVATVCVGARQEVHADFGECQAAKDDAMAWVALDPQSPEPHHALALGLFDTAAPRPAVEETLRRRWSLMPADARKVAETTDRLALFLTEGKLDEALALAETVEPSLPADADVADHASAAMARVSLLVETGQTKRAGEVAKEFLDRMMAYPPHPLSPDPSIGFFEPLLRAGMLTGRELEERRSAWLTGEIRRTRAADPAILEGQRGRLSWLRWALVHAAFAETREEAQAALRAIPTDKEPPVTQRTLRFDFAAGKVLALAGESVHAVEHLRRVVDACAGLAEPQVHIRAHFYLGLALEARGDRQGAREAYRFVLDRWGGAKPKSVTAEKARRHMEALDAR